jgi:hypothetical protein
LLYQLDETDKYLIFPPARFLSGTNQFTVMTEQIR